MAGFAFAVTARDGRARTGVLQTPHGRVDTPAFMPVATAGAVKGLAPMDLRHTGAQIVLSNLYHLTLRPGIDTIERLGGLHEFIGWSGPLLTDSGGYQVFSLARLRSIDAEGVTFRSHLDGELLRLTPEAVVEWQQRLGVDVAMMLDECPPWPVERRQAEAALERTLGWAVRARASAGAPATAVFGIVQGSVYRQLRERAVERVVGLDFPGYAIGGVSVGEPERLRREVVEWTVPSLPEERPRYLMGAGRPEDLLHAVRHGADLFDCVLPSRNARHGTAFTRQGELKLKNARFRSEELPLDPECACPTCRECSRALLHHLVRARDLTAAVLLTRHNLRFYLDFMGELRKAIASGSLASFAVGGPFRELESAARAE